MVAISRHAGVMLPRLRSPRFGADAGANTSPEDHDADAPLPPGGRGRSGAPELIALELVQGVASEAMAETFAKYFSTQRRIESEDPWATALAAARVYAACHAAGYTIRSTLDCLIARLA